MSINTALSAEDTSMKGFMVAPPRTSDPISGALRSAFGQQGIVSDEFLDLLRQIDIAENEATGSC